MKNFFFVNLILILVNGTLINWLKKLKYPLKKLLLLLDSKIKYWHILRQKRTFVETTKTNNLKEIQEKKGGGGLFRREQ